MKLLSLVIVIASLTVSLPSHAKDFDEKDRLCLNQGFVVLYSWYQLDNCIRSKRIELDVITKARGLILTAYPKLQAEIESASPLALKAKEAGTTWSPYDFNDNKNSEYLNRLCNTDADFLQIAASRVDWTEVLSCWR